MELLTVESLLTLAGMSAFIALVTQLIKRIITESRWTNIAAMGVGLVVGLLATLIVRGLTPQTVLDTVLLALVAGATSSGIYEAISNLRGLAGSGPRADV